MSTTSANAAYDASIRDATNDSRHSWRCWDCQKFVSAGTTRCIPCSVNHRITLEIIKRENER